MSLKPEVLDALLKAGASAEMIVAAVKADAVEEEARRIAKREGDRVRQARKRARVTVCHTESRVTHRDDADTRPLPSSPQTPQLPTPTHGDINTRTGEDSAEFDLFWATYPRKIGKDDARKKFAAAIRGGATIGQLVAGVTRDRQRQWLDRPPDMIPHPATWLNQGRWKDEPEQHQPQAQGQPHERRHPPTDKFERHQANLERAVAGSQLAARLRAIEPEGSF